MITAPLFTALECSLLPADSQWSGARVVVDTYSGALAEAGDLLIPMREQAITREHIVADLHELVTRMIPGRTSADEITVFKSVGCALEDLVVANLLWNKA